MRRLVILAPLLLAGCGTAIGNSLGLTSAGSASLRITQTQYGCPNAEAQGAVPLSGFEASCIYDPATNRSSQTIKVQSSDPTQIIAENNRILAGVITGLAAKAATTAATGGAGAVLPLAGSALAMPAPMVPPTP